MSGSNGAEPKRPPSDQQAQGRLTPEEVETLVEQAHGDPERVRALVKTVVQQTIDGVAKSLAGEGGE